MSQNSVAKPGLNDFNDRHLSSLKSDSLYAYTLSKDRLRKFIIEQLTPADTEPGPIIWQEGESEAIFHIDKLRVSIKNSYIIFDTQLETDQSGIGNLVVPFRIGNTVQQATLTITTESLPRGNPSIASRWGTIVQEQLWFALLNAGETFREKNLKSAELQLSGLYCEGDNLVYVFSKPTSIIEIKEYLETAGEEGFEPGHETYNPAVVDLGSSTDEAPVGESSLFQQFLQELYRLFIQFIRFARKFCQLAVFLIQKIIKLIRR